MKKCNLCGETYREYIDFCFNDGEVLALDAGILDAEEDSVLDAPLPERCRVSDKEVSVSRRVRRRRSRPEVGDGA